VSHSLADYMAPEVLKCPLKRSPEVCPGGELLLQQLEPKPAASRTPSHLPCRLALRHTQENKGRAELAYSEAVDAWAAGVLAYELLVGQ